MKTLVVEDVCMMRKLLEKLLSPFGSCDTVENGTEALIKFSHVSLNEERYDVIFLDLILPEISGEEVLREIRDVENNLGVKEAERVKIIICSALSDYENVIKIVKKQCDAYISKPFHKQIIYNTLKKLKLIKSKDIRKVKGFISKSEMNNPAASIGVSPDVSFRNAALAEYPESISRFLPMKSGRE